MQAIPSERPGATVQGASRCGAHWSDETTLVNDSIDAAPAAIVSVRGPATQT